MPVVLDPGVDYDPNAGGGGTFVPSPPPTPPAPPAPPVPSPPPAAPSSPYASDPGVAQARAAREAGLAALEAALRAARSREIIAWGDPDMAQRAGFSVDPSTLALTQQNMSAGLAMRARLNRAAQQRRQMLVNRLASRGVLFSGGLGAGTSQLNQDESQNLYDASEAVLGRLRSIAEQDLRNRQLLNQGVTQAMIDAWRFYAANPEMYGATPPVPAPRF